MRKCNIHNNVLLIFLLLFGAGQVANAQFFKKLKNKILGEEKSPTGVHISAENQTFDTWDNGASDIVAYIVSEFDSTKRTHIVGSIEEDGNFTYKLPDSISTSVPITAFTEECINTKETMVDNPEVKVALAKLLVGKNKEFVGELLTANPIEAASNLGTNKENNGEKGHTYLLVYADGDATIQLQCNKQITMRNEKGQAYKGKLDTNSAINLSFKKGWNVLQNKVIENVPSGMILQATLSELTIVAELPQDIKWMYQPNKN